MEESITVYGDLLALAIRPDVIWHSEDLCHAMQWAAALEAQIAADRAGRSGTGDTAAEVRSGPLRID
jgi:hypothetical protein